METSLKRLSDEELIPLCMDEQDTAFGELVDRYQGRILNLIYRAIGNRARSEELTQDTFVRVFKNLERFDAKYRFSTWIYTIAKNLIRTELSNQAKKPRFVGLGEDGGAWASKKATPDQLVSKKELGACIDRFIHEMPEQYRTVMLMREYQHMSYEEIAQVFQRPEGTIKTWIFRAKKDLAKMLRNIGYDV